MWTDRLCEIAKSSTTEGGPGLVLAEGCRILVEDPSRQLQQRPPSSNRLASARRASRSSGTRANSAH